MALSQKIVIASDHAGYAMKEKIKKWLITQKISFMDLSPEKKEGDDFPDHAKNVAYAVSKSKKTKGILVCGTGMGMAIAANKVGGIRAVTPYDTYTAKMSRIDNDANVIGLRGRKISAQKNITILKTWLAESPSRKKQYTRRIKQISSLEKR
ncbi:MAG: RpiB/LacA/LacB family sugar-phosphate isomerase [Candidatus Woesearchaeota archaeon]